MGPDCFYGDPEKYEDDYQGIVMRGTPAMPKFVEMMGWPVSFIPTRSNTADDYATAIIDAFNNDEIDFLVPMPEALLFEGLVDRISHAGSGDRVLGLNQAGAYIEGDKIKCKQLCREAGIPVADAWDEVDARDYEAILRTCLDYIDRYGGAVLKYPYSARRERGPDHFKRMGDSSSLRYADR